MLEIMSVLIPCECKTLVVRGTRLLFIQTQYSHSSRLELPMHKAQLLTLHRTQTLSTAQPMWQ